MSRGPARALCVAFAFAVGCSHLPGAREVPTCPGPLVSTAEMDGDFLWRGRVRISSGGRTWAFQLVAQKSGDELLLVGLHPMGLKLFTIRQRADRVRVEAQPAPVLEVPPENLLRDLHRLRFAGVLAPDGVEVEFEATGSGEPRAVIRNPECGVRSEFVTLSGDGPP